MFESGQSEGELWQTASMEQIVLFSMGTLEVEHIKVVKKAPHFFHFGRNTLYTLA